MTGAQFVGFAGVFGAVIGSFLNVVIYRLPIGQSIVTPPSRCPKCGYQLKWYDNVPIVGWIMLAVVETMIDRVGGELAETTADAQARNVNAIPPVVTGVAELQACLESVAISRDGLVFPGKLRIRREGRSFEDLAESGALPRP